MLTKMVLPGEFMLDPPVIAQKKLLDAYMEKLDESDLRCLLMMLHTGTIGIFDHEDQVCVCVALEEDDPEYDHIDNFLMSVFEPDAVLA